MASFIDRKLDYLSRELKVRQRRPSAVMTFGDCFFTDSIKTGECFSASAKYHFEIQSFQMFGTVVDSFIAIDKLVMNEKKATLSELVEALDSNFKSNPRLLALCRNADKYGMDTPLSSYHVKRLSKTATDLVMKKNAPYFASLRLFLLPCMQSDTWHLKMGEGFGATPDGRLAHTAFSQNTRPSNGVCVNGLTAMFNSMLDLPHDGLLSGALNLDVDKKQFEGEVGKAQFASMLAVYFNRGGLHAQVTCVGLDALLDAQNNPTEHKDLRVRVTGYSGVFVDICKRLQDDIIKRLK
jgi:formate C-acetyltransferase